LNCFRDLRESKNLSLRDVEKKTGISNGYLSQLESGKVSSPSIQIVMSLATFYEVDIGWLVKKLVRGNRNKKIK